MEEKDRYSSTAQRIQKHVGRPQQFGDKKHVGRPQQLLCKRIVGKKFRSKPQLRLVRRFDGRKVLGFRRQKTQGKA